MDAYTDVRELARLYTGDGDVDSPAAVLERITELETKIATRTNSDFPKEFNSHYWGAYHQVTATLKSHPESRHDTNVAAELAVVWQALEDARVPDRA